MIHLSKNVALHEHRCPDCGQFYACEYEYGRCPRCAHRRIQELESKLDRDERRISAMRGALTRASRRKR